MKESKHYRRRAPGRSLLLIVCMVCILSVGSGNAYAGHDFVFIVDITLSTADWLPELKTQLKNSVVLLYQASPGSRFGIVSFLDYPFDPYGADGEWAYKMVCGLTPDTVVVNAAIDGLESGDGGNSRESQYEAIYQTLLGLGRDLTGDDDFNDPGEISRTRMGWLTARNKVVIMFTWPVYFNDPNADPNYPYAGSQPVANFADVISAIVAQQPLMTFGLFPGPGGIDPQPDVPFYRGRDPLEELCDTTGGIVQDVGDDLSGFEDAIIVISEMIPRNVPSSTEWGLIVLFGMIVLSGTWILLRKRRAALAR